MSYGGRGRAQGLDIARLFRHLVVAAALGVAIAFALWGANWLLTRHVQTNLYQTCCLLVGLAVLLPAITRLVLRPERVAFQTHDLSKWAVGLGGVACGAAVLLGGFVIPAPRPATSSEAAHSTDWAGYETNAQGISSVSASWAVPRLTPPLRTDSAVSCWVGLYDDNLGNLVQIGVDAVVRSQARATSRLV